MEKTNMRTFESSLVTDFFKEQSWRCRAAIATLRNRMGDDWVDLWLIDCFVKDGVFWSMLDIDHDQLDQIPGTDLMRFGLLGSPSDHSKIAIEDVCRDWLSAQNSEKKFGWIDTFLMSIIMQVITKYLIQWLLDNFTIQDSNKTKLAVRFGCHITPQSEWKGKDIWSTAGDDGIVDV